MTRARRSIALGGLALAALAGVARAGLPAQAPGAARAAAPTVGAAFATPDPSNPVAAHARREIVVCLAAPAGGAEPASARRVPAPLAARFSALGVRPVRTLAEAIPDWQPEAAPNPFGLDPSRVILLEADGADGAAAALAGLADDGAVSWVEPNELRWPMGGSAAGATPRAARGGRASEIVLPSPPLLPTWPNDPLFQAEKQWALFNVGYGGPFGGALRADIHVEEAWGTTTGGNDMILAIADTGIDPNHPDLAGTMADGKPRLFEPIDITAFDSAAAYADSFGHGTGIVGAMAARTNNGASVGDLGIAGVCGGNGAGNAGCRIVVIKITPGSAGYATSFDIARALLYATAHGARAMNLSFAGTSPSRIERLAMYEAITHGCVMVGAAGNSNSSDAQYPSAYSVDGLGIQVGASDEFDHRAEFSSYGPGLDLLAPGTDVYTTFMTYPSAAGQSWPGYIPFSGTSIAAPHVTGAVGLLAARRPELIENDFQRILDESADDLGAPGVDSLTGWGRLNVRNAMDAVDTSMGIAHGEAQATPGAIVGEGALTLDESGPGVVDHDRSWSDAEQVTFTATVTVPDSFLDPVRVWPRVGGTFTVRGGFQLPYFAPWAEISAQSARSFTLRGYLYHRVETCANCDEWLPVAPDHAAFGYTILGRVDRPPSLRILAPLGRPSVEPGDTVSLALAASDPDEITRFEVWLDPQLSGPIHVATLPGAARAARIAIPCAGRPDDNARLRVVAIDEHGSQHDQTAASVPIAIMSGNCVRSAMRMRVTPNPVRGSARIEGEAGAEVEIFDLAGRRLRHARLDDQSGGWTWDGRDQHGRLVPPGIYLARTSSAARIEERRVVRLK